MEISATLRKIFEKIPEDTYGDICMTAKVTERREGSNDHLLAMATGAFKRDFPPKANFPRECMFCALRPTCHISVLHPSSKGEKSSRRRDYASTVSGRAVQV
jgi:hypothetical protein